MMENVRCRIVLLLYCKAHAMDRELETTEGERMPIARAGTCVPENYVGPTDCKRHMTMQGHKPTAV